MLELWETDSTAAGGGSPGAAVEGVSKVVVCSGAGALGALADEAEDDGRMSTTSPLRLRPLPPLDLGGDLLGALLGCRRARLEVGDLRRCSAPAPGAAARGRPERSELARSRLGRSRGDAVAGGLRVRATWAASCAFCLETRCFARLAWSSTDSVARAMRLIVVEVLDRRR